MKIFCIVVSAIIVGILWAVAAADRGPDDEE